MAFCSPFDSCIQARPSTSLAYDGKVNAIPSLGFGVLPGLLVDVSFGEPGVAYSRFIQEEEGEQFFASFIGFSKSVWPSSVFPFVICLAPRTHSSIEVP